MIDALQLLTPPQGTGELVPELLAALQPEASSPASAADTYADIGNLKVETWDDVDPALRDQAAIAWAHYRAFDDRATQMSTNMMTASVAGEVARGYSAAQIEENRSKARAWLATFMALQAQAMPTATTSAPPPFSRNVPTQARWP